MPEQFDQAYRFSSLERYTFRQRLVIRAAGLALSILVRVIGATMRFQTTGWEHVEQIEKDGKKPIYSFWHDRIVSSTYFFRNRGIIVLSSHSFDSEYTARCIQRFGFGIVKGSSTRGAISGLVGLIRMMKGGLSAAFTIDGPKGPRYEAKAGPVLLAKKTGNPLVPFVIECKRHWTIKSWDRLQIPKPFTRANVIIGEPVYVDPRINDEKLELKRLELQSSLDDLVANGETWRKEE